MLTPAKELKDKIGQTVKAGCRSCRQDTNHLILACFEQKDNQQRIRSIPREQQKQGYL